MAIMLNCSVLDSNDRAIISRLASFLFLPTLPNKENGIDLILKDLINNTRSETPPGWISDYSLPRKKALRKIENNKEEILKLENCSKQLKDGILEINEYKKYYT